MAADDFFEDFSRHTMFPCVDGRGNVRSVRRRWDDYWSVTYRVSEPGAEPWVKKLKLPDDQPDYGCPAYPPTQVRSLTGCSNARLINQFGENPYQFIAGASACDAAALATADPDG